MDVNIETSSRGIRNEIGLVRSIENFPKRQGSCPRRNNNARFLLSPPLRGSSAKISARFRGLSAAPVGKQINQRLSGCTLLHADFAVFFAFRYPTLGRNEKDVYRCHDLSI